jgi:hypothetical protein
VGDGFVVDVRDADPNMLWLASAKLGTHVPVAEIRSGAYRPPPVTTTSVAPG